MRTRDENGPAQSEWVRFCVSLQADLYEHVARQAALEDSNRAQVIRRAIREYLVRRGQPAGQRGEIAMGPQGGHGG